MKLACKMNVMSLKTAVELPDVPNDLVLVVGSSPCVMPPSVVVSRQVV